MLRKWLRTWLGVDGLLLYIADLENRTVESIIRNREYSDKLQQEIERTRQLVLQIGQKLGMTNNINILVAEDNVPIDYESLGKCLLGCCCEECLPMAPLMTKEKLDAALDVMEKDGWNK